MRTLDGLNTSFSRSIQNSPSEVVLGMKPNGIPKILGVTNNEVRLEDVIHRTDDGSKAILETSLSNTKEQTDKRPAVTQQSCEQIKRNHGAFVDFSYHNKRDNPSETSLKVTCPNRQAIRQKTSNALKQAREVMMNKYEKTKKIKVAEYKQGDNVSLFVPRNIRHETDRRRLACIVINKSSGCYPTYNLLSEYGTLNRRFTGNSLMPFPGIIKAGPPTREIVLSEAYKMSQVSEVVFCHCKTTCNTKSCGVTVLPNYALQDVTSITRGNVVTTDHHQKSQMKHNLNRNIVFHFLVVELILMEVS